MTSILYEPKIQISDRNGPVAMGYIYTYAESSSTPKSTWQDYDKTALNTNPIRLDADGRASVFLDGNYKITVADANDVPIYTIDKVHSLSDYDFTGLNADVSDLNSTITEGTYKAADYSVVIGDRGKNILVNATSANTNISLPPIGSVPNKFRITVKKIDFLSNYVKIITNLNELIDGQDDFYLYDYGDVVELLADGSQWRIIGAYIRGTIKKILSPTYTIGLNDFDTTLWVNTSSNAVTLNLPSILTVGKAFKFSIKALIPGSNPIIIQASGADLIEGVPSIIISGNGEGLAVKGTGDAGPLNSWIVSEGAQQNGDTITGDTKTSFNIAQNGNWLLMNDGYDIGKQGSGAHYAQDSAHNLFLFLYNSYSDTVCPVSGGRSAPPNAEADWQAGKKLRLPLAASRVIGVAGSGTGLTVRAAADLVGVEFINMDSSQIAGHNHLSVVDLPSADGQYLGSEKVNYSGSGNGHFGPTADANQAFHTSTSGSASNLPVMQPTIFEYHFIRL